MTSGKRRSTSLVLVLAAGMAGGCTNLGAVREFTATSADMTGYRGATEHYVGSAERQLADLPADRRFDATRGRLDRLRTVTAQDRITLLKLHATASGYMGALAQLAGEDAYSISPEVGKVSGAIQASDVLKIDAGHIGAYANITQRVSDWALAATQARDVKRMVERNGADIDKLLEAMQLATAAYGVVLDQEIQSYEAVADYRQAQWTAKLPGDAALTPERREVIATLLRRSALAETAAQQRARRDQQAAAAAIDRVRQAHRLMLENVDRLGSKEIRAALRAAASDLKSIHRSISDL